MDNSKVNDSSRRNFLNWVIGIGITGWVVSILYPLIEYIIPPQKREAKINSVLVGKIDNFKPMSGTIFKFGDKPGILVRLSNGDFKAFSAVCTHLDCTVQFDGDRKVIWCACHNGTYNLNGTNIAGPPPKPLTEYVVILKGDEIFVKKGA